MSNYEKQRPESSAEPPETEPPADSDMETLRKFNAMTGRFIPEVGLYLAGASNIIYCFLDDMGNISTQGKARLIVSGGGWIAAGLIARQERKKREKAQE